MVLAVLFTPNMSGIQVKTSGWTQIYGTSCWHIYLYALSIANNVVLWKWNRVVEDKIS